MLLLGEPLHSLFAVDTSASAILDQARSEQERWSGALETGSIPFREWKLEPIPRLAEGNVAAHARWERELLLRGAATASDLHFLPVAGLVASAASGFDPSGSALRRPMIELLEDEGEEIGEAVSSRWSQLRSRAVELLARRLDALQG